MYCAGKLEAVLQGCLCIADEWKRLQIRPIPDKRRRRSGQPVWEGRQVYRAAALQTTGNVRVGRIGSKTCAGGILDSSRELSRESPQKLAILVGGKGFEPLTSSV